MEYLGDARHANLYANAEGEEGYQLIDNLIPYRAYFLNNPLALR